MKDAIVVGKTGPRIVIAHIHSYGEMYNVTGTERTATGQIWINSGHAEDAVFEAGEFTVEQLDEAVRAWYGIPKDNRRKLRKPTPYALILDLYHKHCPMLPKVEQLTEQRETLVAARWHEYCGDCDREVGIDRFEEFFRRVTQQKFLTGGGPRGWRATFTWLMKQENFAKVMEMTYANQAP